MGQLSESIITSIKNNQNIMWNDVIMLSKQEFSMDYFNVVKVLLTNLHPTMFKPAESGSEHDKDPMDAVKDIILKPVPEILIFLTSTICQEKSVDSFKTETLISLLKNVMYERNIIKDIIFNQSKDPRLEFSTLNEELIKTFIRIPSIVSNVMKMKLANEFTLNIYFERLINVIYESLKQCHRRLVNGKDVNLTFVTKLINKIVMYGHIELIWSQLLCKLVVDCKENYIFRRFSRRILINQSNNSIETILKILFCKCENVMGIVTLLDQSYYVNKNSSKLGNTIRDNWLNGHDHVIYLLATKFLTIATLETPNAVISLVTYNFLMSFDGLFVSSMMTALKAWTSYKLLRHRSHEQNIYINAILMASCNVINRRQEIDSKVINKQVTNLQLISDEVRKEMIELTRKGIEDRVSCPDKEVRDVGFFVGQTLLRALDPVGSKIDLEIDDDSNVDIAYLKQFLTGSFVRVENEDNVAGDQLKTEISANKLIEVLSSDDEEAVADDRSKKSARLEEEDDIPMAPLKKPSYLLDCISGLGDMDNVEWSITCLECLEPLLRRNPLTTKENSIEVTKILVHSQNNTDHKDFQGLKMRSLLAACVSNPVNVAKYLISVFFDTNSCMSHRLDILQVLVLAAHELSDSSLASQLFNSIATLSSDSSGVDQIQESIKAFDINPRTSSLMILLDDDSDDMKCDFTDILVPKEVAIVENSWREIVNERIEMNTKRKLRSSSKPEPKMNQFSKICGHFFFPLMDGFTKSEVTFYFQSFDSLILSRLIYSLSLILMSVSQSFEARKMCKELIQFTSEFINYEDVLVKKSIIFAISTIITSCPSVYLFTELGHDLGLLKPWLLTISESDVNSSDLRNNSIESLKLLNCVINYHEQEQLKAIN